MRVMNVECSIGVFSALVLACGGPATDLAGYAPAGLTASLVRVKATEPAGPRLLQVTLAQSPGACAALGRDVSATVAGMTLTPRHPGGWVSAPRIGSGGRLDGRDCQAAWFELAVDDDAAAEAINAAPAIVIEDASARLVAEVVEPLTPRQLSRSGSGPLRPGDALELTWSPAARLEGSTAVVDYGSPATADVVPVEVTATGARVIVPAGAPPGPAQLSLRGLSPAMLRCEGFERCAWLDGTRFRDAALPIAISN